MTGDAYGEPISPRNSKSAAASDSKPVRQIKFEHNRDLGELLERMQSSILISTYQAGKVAVLNSMRGKIDLSLHNYDRPMGLAIDERNQQLAVATRDAIWFAYNRPDVASSLQPAFGACFLTRSCHINGRVQAHQIGWGTAGLYLANTAFSCLCTLDEQYSFRPIWRPPFITELAAEDRCHLNGMAMLQGRPRYITMLAQSNVAEGWRATKATSGCLMDVESNEIIAGGLSMPHSPVVRNDVVLLLNSGVGSLIVVDRKTGQTNELARFPGYTRGLAVHQNWAVIGLSKIRESTTFGGLPISGRRSELKCGIAIVNLATGKLEGQFEFKTGVEEIFDVVVAPGIGGMTLRGPHLREDEQDDIWLVPTEASDE